MTDYYKFPICMFAFGAALMRENIDPGCVEVLLPFDEWWKLANAVEREFQGMLRYDGSQKMEPTEFRFRGVLFKVKQ